ncbi:MAG: DUF1269 domain-containing protein [Actinobacteria bacterium]|nr:DUF1269 domain-containing protein [Actinomycetota bacterium]
MADLIILKFNDTYGAQAALSAVRALTELRKAWIDDVAVVEKHKSGRVSTHTPHGSVTGGALWGALLGMLLFWWFPPLWFLGGWAGGAAVGGLIGKAMKNSGLDEKMIDEVKAELTNGTSILLLMGASGDADEMAEAFKPYNPVKVIRHEIAEQTVENLKEQLAEQPAPPAES